MKKVLIISLFILFCGINAFSQTSDKSVCPSISIIGPASTVMPGEAMTFTASIVGFDAEKHKIIWSVDKGTIIGDSGKLTIEVDTTGLSEEVINATLEIEGLLPEVCASTFSENGIVAGIIPICDWDEWGNISDNDIKVRLDLFFVEILNNSDSIGYFVSYGLEKEVNQREKLIRKHAKHQKFDLNRIVVLYKGEEKVIRTRIFIMPKDADFKLID